MKKTVIISIVLFFAVYMAKAQDNDFCLYVWATDRKVFGPATMQQCLEKEKELTESEAVMEKLFDFEVRICNSTDKNAATSSSQGNQLYGDGYRITGAATKRAVIPETQPNTPNNWDSDVQSQPQTNTSGTRAGTGNNAKRTANSINIVGQNDKQFNKKKEFHERRKEHWNRRREEEEQRQAEEKQRQAEALRQAAAYATGKVGPAQAAATALVVAQSGTPQPLGQLKQDLAKLRYEDVTDAGTDQPQTPVKLRRQVRTTRTGTLRTSQMVQIDPSNHSNIVHSLPHVDQQNRDDVHNTDTANIVEHGNAVSEQVAVTEAGKTITEKSEYDNHIDNSNNNTYLSSNVENNQSEYNSFSFTNSTTGKTIPNDELIEDMEAMKIINNTKDGGTFYVIQSNKGEQKEYANSLPPEATPGKDSSIYIVTSDKDNEPKYFRTLTKAKEYIDSTEVENTKKYLKSKFNSEEISGVNIDFQSGDDPVNQFKSQVNLENFKSDYKKASYEIKTVTVTPVKVNKPPVQKTPTEQQEPQTGTTAETPGNPDY
ncbi:MAG: hypothetical protein LBD45_00825 [Bacteroidales bacterium]|jgi:hypothetical protein|nr:hypothetical protein [Bacteroidales bacterium]